MTGPLLLASSSINTGGWKWTGNFTTLDLIAAGTNALNGALLARRPDHYKNFTVVGIMLMALLMGLGGGSTRDVLVNQIPNALTNPAYITVAVICGAIGYFLAYGKGQLFREGLFQFMTSFSLPLYAIVGAQKGESAGLPVLGAAGPGRDRPDRRPVVCGRLQRGLAQALRARRMVRGHRLADRDRLDYLRRGRAQYLVVRWDLLRRRLHPARDGAISRLGGASGQRTRRCLQARRWPSPAGAQDPG
jgi:Glycine transporter